MQLHLSFVITIVITIIFSTWYSYTIQNMNKLFTICNALRHIVNKLLYLYLITIYYSYF